MQKKILIVEDDITSAHFLQSFVSDLGYGVLGICESGEIAVDVIKKDCPDLILMDITLIGSMTGIDVAYAVEKYCQCVTDIIFITGTMKQDVVNEVAKIKGFKGILFKPFDHLLLTKLIQRSLHD